MILEAQKDIFKTEDILETIKQHGHEIAVVLLPGKILMDNVIETVRSTGSDYWAAYVGGEKNQNRRT